MKSKPECDRCFMRQAENAARRMRLGEAQRQQLLDSVAEQLQQAPIDVPPPVRASRVHACVREHTHNPDPYLEAKQAATAHALTLYPRLKAMIAAADDPLDTAIRLAIAGNIIDLGVADEYDLEASIQRVLKLRPAIDQLDRLKSAIGQSATLLYLADNAGETVMDRLLIETMSKPVTYVVKGGPAVNDATRADAIAAGLHHCCEIIDNGAASLGTLLDQCSSNFVQRFNKAELIIAKGMANYESLAGTRSGLYFLLQAKCAVIADHLGVVEKSIIVLEDQAR